MKKNNDKDNKDPQPEVYVVTRDRRRTSDRNFQRRGCSQEAQYWINICRNYDSSKVSIVKTNKPRKIPIMYNWKFEKAEGEPTTPKKKVTAPKKKSFIKKNANDSAMDTVEGDDNIIYF